MRHGPNGPGGTAAHAVDTNAEADFTNRMNALRSSQGIATLGTHSVLTAKAQAWAQHMADSGCLCHSNLPDGVTVGWRKLSENIGRGPSVASIDTALVNSPLHYANMVDGAVHWVGTATNYGSPWFGWNIARDLTVWPDGRGYAVIDGFGGVHRFGSARAPGPTP